jgi:hypothetical protein
MHADILLRDRGRVSISALSHGKKLICLNIGQCLRQAARPGDFYSLNSVFFTQAEEDAKVVSRKIA